MLSTGDMGPLYDRREGWDYAKMLREHYQSVVRVKGLLGVRRGVWVHSRVKLTLRTAQCTVCR